MISVVVVLAYDELNNQRNVLGFLAAQNPLYLLIILVPLLLDESVDLVKVITDLVLKVYSNSFNFVANSVFLTNSRNLRDIQIFRGQSFFLSEDYFLGVLAFDTSFHISQQKTISLLFKGLLFFKHTAVMAFLLGNHLVVASLVFSITLGVEVVFLEGNSFGHDVVIFGSILGMLLFLLEED